MSLLPFTHKLWLLRSPDDPPGAGDADPPGEGNPPDGEGKKSYTQAELNALFNERAKRASRTAVSELLTALGVSDVETLKTRLAAAAEAEEADATELSKAQKKLADEKARADRLEQEKKDAEERAQLVALRAALNAEALQAGIDAAELGSLWREFKDDTTLRELVEANEAGDEFTGLDEVVKRIAKAHPRWLAAEPEGGRRRNINAKERGTAQQPSLEELIAKKRRSGNYSGV